MINARELRIGNWLNWNGSASQIQSGGINLFEEGKLHIEPRPIPLTNEWLLRFGFEKKVDISGYYFSKDGHRVYLFQNGKFEFEFNYVDVKRVNLFKTFQSVHQLQNLYFALTGQELELK